MKVFYFFVCCLMLLNCSKKEPLSFPISEGSLGEITTIKNYGGSKNDVANAVVKTQDGGAAVLGYTQSINGDISDKTVENFDFWILKLDAENNIQWSKTFGGSEDDRGNDILQTKDGGFAILGYSTSSNLDVPGNAGSQDFWMIKLDANGTISWSKTFGYLGADFGTTLLQTADNSYLITGVLDVTASGGQGNSRNSQRHAGGDIWAIKLSENGDLQWSKYFGGSFTDAPFGIVETEDHNFIIAGSSDSADVDISNNNGSYDFWVLKITSNGSLLWERSFGGSEIDEARAITATNDGNFIIVGDTRSADKDVSNNHGAADVWIIKMNTDGNLIWEKTIGGSSFDVARSVARAQDNGFIISGSSRSLNEGFTNQGQNDALLLKIDAEGNLVWKQTIGGDEIDYFYDAVQLNNASIIAVGETNSSNGDLTENKGFSDALIIKTN
jgi:mannose/fructose-specific phosphotransferase system component IIA